jgi:hypothetical protein
MRRRDRLAVVPLIVGGVAAAAAGAVVIDMPSAPGPATEHRLGDLALSRYARARSAPAYRHWGDGYGYRYRVYPVFPVPVWGWGWGGYGWPRAACFRSPCR